MNFHTTPAPHENPLARFRLATGAEDWLQALARAATADDHGDDLSPSEWRSPAYYVHVYGVVLDDRFSPKNRTRHGLREAGGLLDAAWDGSVLTGPYRPSLLSEPVGHRIVLDLGSGLPQFASPAASPDLIGGGDERGVSAALLFLRYVVEEANRLLDRLDTYLRMRIAQLERARLEAATFLAEQPDRSPGSTDRRESFTVKFGRHLGAFFAGAKAGQEILSALETITGQVPDFSEGTGPAAFFWARIGRRLHATRPEAPASEELQFLRGASVTVPPPATPFLLLRLDQAPDTLTDDVGEDRFRELADLIAGVADHVQEGIDAGDVRDGAGRVIGTFRVRWSR